MESFKEKVKIIAVLSQKLRVSISTQQGLENEKKKLKSENFILSDSDSPAP